MELRLLALIVFLIASMLNVNASTVPPSTVGVSAANLKPAAIANEAQNQEPIRVVTTEIKGQDQVKGSAVNMAPVNDAPVNDAGKCQVVMSTNKAICGNNLACITVTRDAELVKVYPHLLWTTQVNEYWKSHTKAKIDAIQFTKTMLNKGDCRSVRIEPYIGFESVRDHSIMEFRSADKAMLRKLDKAVQIMSQELKKKI